MYINSIDNSFRLFNLKSIQESATETSDMRWYTDPVHSSPGDLIMIPCMDSESEAPGVDSYDCRMKPQIVTGYTFIDGRSSYHHLWSAVVLFFEVVPHILVSPASLLPIMYCFYI